MKLVRAAGVAAVILTAVAAGCSSTQSGTGQVDGGNPAGCPSSTPSNGAACSNAGLDCTYGCNVNASCDGHTWTVVSLGIPCPSDAGGPVGCGANADCPSGYSCSPGGTSVGCGICIAPQNPCNTDTDCKIIDDAAATKPYVCGPGSECECGIGGKNGECIPACTGPTDCGGDEACFSGHCVPKPCSSDADCPSPSTVDYACSPAAGVCAPKACASNADCGGAHYCVNGTCYSQAGACVPPAA